MDSAREAVHSLLTSPSCLTPYAPYNRPYPAVISPALDQAQYIALALLPIAFLSSLITVRSETHHHLKSGYCGNTLHQSMVFIAGSSPYLPVCSKTWYVQCKGRWSRFCVVVYAAPEESLGQGFLTWAGYQPEMPSGRTAHPPLAVTPAH